MVQPGVMTWEANTRRLEVTIRDTQNCVQCSSPTVEMVEYEIESGLVSPSSSRGGGLQLPDFEESDFYVEQEQVITIAT